MLVVKTVDLLVCGIAAQNGLVVLHDDRTSRPPRRIWVTCDSVPSADPSPAAAT